QLVAVVVVAGVDRAQVLHQLLGVAPVAAHPDLAEAVGRAALELHHERSAPRLRVDARFALRDARAGVAESGHLAQRAAFRRVPLVLAEGLAAAQRPGVAHALEDRRRLRVLDRGPAEA